MHKGEKERDREEGETERKKEREIERTIKLYSIIMVKIARGHERTATENGILKPSSCIYILHTFSITIM